MAIPGLAEHTRRQIAPCAMAVPGMTHHTRRHTAPYHMTVPDMTEHTRRGRGARITAIQRQALITTIVYPVTTGHRIAPYAMSVTDTAYHRTLCQ
eukprot:3883463-Rhodomonas_salina.1